MPSSDFDSREIEELRLLRSFSYAIWKMDIAIAETNNKTKDNIFQCGRYPFNPDNVIKHTECLEKMFHDLNLIFLEDKLSGKKEN